MKPLLLALVLAALLLPASALGKGPSGASIDGPGTGGGITFASGGESDGSLADLAQQAGFFAAAFGQEPDPLLTTRPTGDLGPKYTITYTVPDQSSEVSKLRQDVYPYAKPAPVTHMRPGQKIFEMQTRGGWFRAGPALKQTLVAAGLPSTPATTGSTASEFPTALISLLTALLLVAMTTGVLIRRRTRPAAA